VFPGWAKEAKPGDPRWLGQSSMEPSAESSRRFRASRRACAEKSSDLEGRRSRSARPAFEALRSERRGPSARRIWLREAPAALARLRLFASRPWKVCRSLRRRPSFVNDEQASARRLRVELGRSLPEREQPRPVLGREPSSRTSLVNHRRPHPSTRPSSSGRARSGFFRLHSFDNARVGAFDRPSTCSNVTSGPSTRRRAEGSRRGAGDPTRTPLKTAPFSAPSTILRTRSSGWLRTSSAIRA